MMLAQIFVEQAGLTGDARSAFHPELEAALRQMVEAGAASWPAIEIAPADFVRFLARQLPPELREPKRLVSLQIRDLYLVCAVGLGHRTALSWIESNQMSEVQRTLGKLGTPPALIADVVQSLYSRLLERQNAHPEVPVLRRGFSGQGELTGWLCTCAVHEATRRYKRAKQEISFDEASGAIWGTQGRSPEQTMLSGQLKEAFQLAFRDAVNALTSRERNLLRYHYLSDLSIDQIGTLYHVHRATAARWVAQARERLTSDTRKRFLQRVPTREGSLPQVMELIRSQLTVNLAMLLQQSAARDLPPEGSTSEE